MNQAELWWAVVSVLFILPLGILVMLCIRCRRSRSRTIIREETRRKTHSVQTDEDKKGFEVVRSFTVSRTEQKPSLEPETENVHASNVAVSSLCRDLSPNYMNLNIENNHRLEQDYINPLSEDYYCTPRELLKSADEDDSNSYENVEISKVESQTSVDSTASYENCEYAVKWKAQEKQKGESGENDDDDDDDDEPDYVNTVPCPSL
ncbi:linker for activation of T-cells family member 2-like isoform X2 [Pristis pectinata]|nr:linker for activation of T-cells family member 2-like isoform X2 [Pristis pectinata]